ncbi:MAG: hypothetical protein GF355_15920, partial [Candidatus Eisenbacteria bacterium]|nr:hypothetical protein [Candidatus Eisenbacteria bacterium]
MTRRDRAADRMLGRLACVVLLNVAWLPAEAGVCAASTAPVAWIEAWADSSGTHIRVPFDGDVDLLQLDEPPRWAIDMRPARKTLGGAGALWSAAAELGALTRMRLGQF